jgi:serine/threonine-protein kinase SRK2
MPEPRARWVFFQIASALDYCHKQGVCHRDLKLENLLLVDHDADLVKVTDFGLSKDTSDSIAKTKVGTISYMAPEVTVAGGRAGDPGAGAYDGKASDVWSLGVILYVLIACSYPFGYGARWSCLLACCVPERRKKAGVCAFYPDLATHLRFVLRSTP